MKFANLKEFKGRKFRVIYAINKKPISDKVGDFDQAYREMTDIMSSQGVSDEAFELQEVFDKQ
jgi:hypothetical protein